MIKKTTARQITNVDKQLLKSLFLEDQDIQNLVDNLTEEAFLKTVENLRKEILSVKVVTEQIQKMEGPPGHTPTDEELTALIKPLIPEPILTEEDKKDIASKIEVPVVEKVIEKRTVETIVKEQPIIKEVIPESVFKEIEDLKKSFFPFEERLGSIEKSNTLKPTGPIDQRWRGAGLSKVSTDSTLTGTGTPSSPLHVVSSGGGTPGGLNTQVQFNDSGSFGGDAGLTFTKATGVLTVNTISNSFSNDGSNFTIPATRDMLRFLDQATSKTIGTLRIGTTGMSTDFLGFAFFGTDDFSAIGANTSNLFLGGFSGYGALHAAGDVVTGNTILTASNNIGNFFPNIVNIGIVTPPSNVSPNYAQLYVQYATNPNGSPTYLAQFTDQSTDIVITPDVKMGIGTDAPDVNLTVVGQEKFESTDGLSLAGAPQVEQLQVLSDSTGPYVNLGRFDINQNVSRGAFMLSNSGDGAGWQDNFMAFFVHGASYTGGNFYPTATGATTDAGKAMILAQGSVSGGYDNSILSELIVGSYNAAPVSFFSNSASNGQDPALTIQTDNTVKIWKSLNVTNMPTSDPMDGMNTLWYDVTTRVVFMGT